MTATATGNGTEKKARKSRVGRVGRNKVRPLLMTSGDVCAITGCAEGSIRKWCSKHEAGDLRGLASVRLPFSRDRRFRLADVVAFLEAHGWEYEAGRLRAGFAGVAVALPPSVCCRTSLVAAEDLFQLGEMMASGTVWKAAVGCWWGRSVALDLVRRLTRRGCRVVGVVGVDDGRPEDWYAAGAVAVVPEADGARAVAAAVGEVK